MLRSGGYEQNQRTAKDIAHLPYSCSSSYQTGDNRGTNMLVGIYYLLPPVLQQNCITRKEKKRSTLANIIFYMHHKKRKEKAESSKY
jgi:hypothetical protein